MTDRLHRMQLIRYLETRLQELCNQGLAGDLHFNRGQEAIAVGVTAAMRPQDRMVTHHRTIAHYVARAASLLDDPATFWNRIQLLVNELLERKTGIRGGLAGEMHISDPGLNYDFAFQIVGTCIPVAAGIAWAHKNHIRDDSVTVCFFGDAATANGQFHEGLNIAAVHRLPILFVCEDNGRAGNIAREHYTPWSGVYERFKGYGIIPTEVDGNEVERVREEALQEMSVMSRPAALICHTERLCWHKQGQRDIRTPEQLAKAAERDPLRDAPELDAETRERIDTIIERALSDEKAEEYCYE